MYKLRGRLGTKIFAAILLLVFGNGMILSTAGVLLTEQGYGTHERYYEDPLCREPAKACAERALHYALYLSDSRENGEGITDFLGERYRGASCRVDLISGNGLYVPLLPELAGDGDTVVLRTMKTTCEPPPRWLLEKMETGMVQWQDGELLIAEQPYTQEYIPFSEDRIDWDGKELYGSDGDTDLFDENQETGTEYRYMLTVRLTADPESWPFSGAFAGGYRLYNLLQVATPWLAPAALLFGILSAAMLFLLISGAGRRCGHEEVVLNWQDRIPLDLYLAFDAGVALVLFSVAKELRFHGDRLPLLSLIGLAVCILTAEGLLFALIMTAAARCKGGQWWRNTILFRGGGRLCRLLRTFFRMVREVVGAIPLVWRTALTAGIFLLVQLLLSAMSFWTGYHSGTILLLAVLALVDIGALCFVILFARQLRTVHEQARELAQGNLDSKADTDSLWLDIREHGEYLNAIGDGMHTAVEQRLRSERLKTELITNVSHDIKTPLTSIVSYVDLLKKEELPEAAQEYTAILDRQSRRLKKLTEDLVEASKASTGNISVHIEPLVVNELLLQAIGDYDDRLTAGKLEIVVNAYQGNIHVLADGRLLWRVLDNLFSNICKYALGGTRVYVDITEDDRHVLLTVKNISREPLNESADELLERFVRGDASRHTEGSGLGLNIAGSLMELMGGEIEIFCDGDLFKVQLTLRRAPDREESPAPEEI